MFQEMTEETLKVRLLYNRKKSNQLFPRVRYQEIAMAGDGDGFYGYAEAIKNSARAAEATAQSRSTLNWIQLRLGCAPYATPTPSDEKQEGAMGPWLWCCDQHPRSTSQRPPNDQKDAPRDWHQRLPRSGERRHSPGSQPSKSSKLSDSPVVVNRFFYILLFCLLLNSFSLFSLSLRRCN